VKRLRKLLDQRLRLSMPYMLHTVFEIKAQFIVRRRLFFYDIRFEPLFYVIKEE
jgi:hypothetical protein